MRRPGVGWAGAMLALGALLLRPDACAAPSSDIIELTHLNYESYKDEELMLLTFFAPWCGNCKKLMPELEAAATTLADEEPDVVVAKIDGTEEEALAKKHGVEGWPTLLWFRDGTYTKFPTLQTAEELVDYVGAKVAPPVVKLKDKAALHAFTQALELAVVFFGDDRGERFQAFATVADGDPASAGPHKPYGHVTKASLFPEDGDGEGSMVMYKRLAAEGGADTEAEEIWYRENSNRRPFFSVAGMEAWGQLEALPPVVPVSRALSMEWKTNFKHMLLFVDGAKDGAGLASAREAMTAAHPQYKQACINIIVDVSDKQESAQALEYFGVEPADCPLVRGFDQASGDKFHPTAPYEPTQSFFLDFVQELFSGRLKPQLKSEEPADPADSEDQVVTVVGDTFDELVLRRGEDVALLLEVYAPWCGHCKQLAPTYAELAHHYKDEDEIVVAKMVSLPGASRFAWRCSDSERRLGRRTAWRTRCRG